MSFKLVSCRFSFGSLEAIDIPASRQHQTSAAAFGSSDDFAKHYQQAVAIEFVHASFAWEMLSENSTLGLGENSLHHWSGDTAGRRSSIVLRDVDLAIPGGRLTVVHGEVGSGTSLPLGIYKATYCVISLS